MDSLTREEVARGVPWKEDHDGEVDRPAVGRVLQPVSGMGPRDPRLLTDTLRTDHDVREIELHVRKCAKKRGVELLRAGVALPAVAGRHDLIHTVRRQGRQEPGDVARVLGQRVRLP